MRVEYHPEAADDLNRATAEYNNIRDGLGDSLREEIYGAIGWITITLRRAHVLGFVVIIVAVRMVILHLTSGGPGHH